MIVLYSKNNCNYCNNAVKLLKSHGIAFEQIKLDTQNDISAFKDTYPNVRSLPYILHKGKPIGGYNELLIYINNGGLDGENA